MLGVIAAINSVIAFYYYMAVVRRMWFHEPEERGVTVESPPTPIALTAAMFLSTAVVLVVGVVPTVRRTPRRARLHARLTDALPPRSGACDESHR